MRTKQAINDKLAMGLSLACTFHCIALPALLVVLPSLAILNDELFHIIMVIAVVPISIYALTLGYKQHQRRSLFALGCAGLLLLIAALVVGHDLGEVAETGLTVFGAFLVAVSHWFNYKLHKAFYDDSTVPSQC